MGIGGNLRRFRAGQLHRMALETSMDDHFMGGIVDKYFGTHDIKLPKDWAPDQNVMNDFHQYLLKEGVNFTEGEFAENNDWLKQQLRREMFITAFGVEEARKLAIETDPLVLHALDSFAKARALQENARKTIALRKAENGKNR